jgi:hypothetical protein
MAGLLGAVGSALGTAGSAVGGAAATAGSALWKGVSTGLAQMGKGFLSGAGQASPILGKVLPNVAEAAKIKNPATGAMGVADVSGATTSTMGRLGQLAGQYAGSRFDNPYVRMFSEFTKPKMESVYGGKARQRNAGSLEDIESWINKMKGGY